MRPRTAAPRWEAGVRPIKPLSARPLTSSTAGRQQRLSAGATARSPRAELLRHHSAGPRHHDPAAFIPTDSVRGKLYKATCVLPAHHQNTAPPSNQCPACGHRMAGSGQVEEDPAVALRDEGLQRLELAVEALQREADSASTHQHQNDKGLALHEQLARERQKCAELQKMCERQQADLKAAHRHAEMLSAKLGDLVDMDQSLQVNSLLA